MSVLALVYTSLLSVQGISVLVDGVDKMSSPQSWVNAPCCYKHNTADKCLLQEIECGMCLYGYVDCGAHMVCVCVCVLVSGGSHNQRL